MSSGLGFVYDVVRLVGDDKWVSCAVSNAYAAYEHSTFYPSTSQGVADSYCSVQLDADGTSTGGYWVFQDNTPGPRVTYRDSGSDADGAQIAFSQSNCSTY